MTENDQATEQLTSTQELLISCLVSGLNITAAAKAAGIGDKTARRWLKLPHFQRAYKDAQRSLFDQALTGLMLKVDKAIATLDRNMTEASPYTQVSAAKIVLEQAIAVHKMSELEQKVAQLEELLRVQRKI